MQDLTPRQHRKAELDPESNSIIASWAAQNIILITPTQLSQLTQHRHMVLETNKQMNLTSITEPAEFAVKHIIDSLTLLPYIPSSEINITLADIGTGAGFPGLVLAIMRPDIHVILIDSLRKRTNFLQAAIDNIGLTNVEAVHSRAEDLARMGKTFDICTARAVARLDKLTKWILPLTKSNGTFLAMKGPNPKDELQNAKPAIAKLGGYVETVDIVEISPGLKHSIVVIKKIAPPNGNATHKQGGYSSTPVY